MRMSKKLQKILLSLLVISAVTLTYDFNVSHLTSSVVFAAKAKAELHTYTGIGEYIGSDKDSTTKSKQRARENAERNAGEQAGIFISTHSTNTNGKLNKEESIIVAGGMLKVKEIKTETISLKSGYVKYRTIVNAQIDIAKLEEAINRFARRYDQLRSADVNQYETLKKLNDEQTKRITELEAHIANDDAQQQIKIEYTAIIKELSYIQKLEAANKSRMAEKHKNAIKLYGEAIELNPTSSSAYFGRACSHGSLKNYQQAIEDYSKTIQIDPNHSEAYKGRGIIYDILKDYKQAIADYSEAIKINPNDMYTYRRRGVLYYRLDDTKRGSADLAKVKELTEMKDTETQK